MPFISAVELHAHFFAARAVQDFIDALRRQRVDRRVQVDVIAFRHRFNHLPVISALLPRTVPFQGRDGAFIKGAVRVRDQQIGIDFLLAAQPLAVRARAVRRIERKRAWLDFRQADAVNRAGQVFGVIQVCRRIDAEVLHRQIPFAQFQRGFDRIGQAGAHLAAFILIFRLADYQPVHHGFNRVILVAVQRDFILQAVHRAVGAHAHKTGLADLIQHSLVGALAAAHDRREDQQTRAFGQVFQGIHDFLRRLLAHLAAAHRAMRDARAGKQQAHVIIDFRDRADRGARIVRSAFLIDRYSRRQPIDVIDIRLVHLPEELARVRGERFDVAALAFGKDRIERQRAFPRP